MAKIRITVESVSDDGKLTCNMADTIEYKNVMTLQEKANDAANNMIYNVCHWIIQNNDNK